MKLTEALALDVPQLLLAVAATPAVAVLRTDDELIGWDLQSGSVRWTVALPAHAKGVPTVLTIHDECAVTMCQGPDAATFLAVRLGDGGSAWRTEVSGVAKGGFGIAGGRVGTIIHEADAPEPWERRELDPTTGAVLDRFPALRSKYVRAVGPWLVAGGKAPVVCTPGSAETRPLPGKRMNGAFGDGDDVFFASKGLEGGFIIGWWDAGTGTLKGSFQHNGMSILSPGGGVLGARPGRAFVRDGNEGGALVDVDTGETVWSVSTPDPVSSAAYIPGAFVFSQMSSPVVTCVAEEDGSVSSLEMDGGARVRTSVGDGVFVSDMERLVLYRPAR